ncbi:MAG TPA: EscU/YscU/HrcU family type III secretion system export apparatus switch protein [Spirochaetota bacterium]|nr:EscU/YscU/HrcU family type III secretion system export apparatus switch protein [Spirochaetota bacterium]HOL56736.1 EscU/YscU/HrcU family type III secretion system export apparatus switch protein [Spirochaetota bacterium]HPP04171.1 EscU/YscU/HrcU family type III secretion system export apparatus switch protein [Spirochaetota bacterium]
MKKKAVAIKYLKENLDVPVIVAKGEGDFAKKIIDEAIKNGIEVVKNSDIFKYEDLFIVGKEIPEEIYEIVASILAYVIKTNSF